MGRSRSWTLCALAALLVAAPGAYAGSLPKVSSGQLPGPPLLYKPAPGAPILSVRSPFHAKALLVSGSEAYRDGEYLYQDYLFDDRGADTVPSETRSGPGSDIASPTAGDVRYPTANRYANNAADLVEFRVKPTGNAIVYRVTLNTVKDKDAAVVGIGIDLGPEGDEVRPWPRGAGISSKGIDRFITAWGTGGEVEDLHDGTTTKLDGGDVSIDLETNQMTIRVPRKVMDPGRATWRYVAGTGLWDGKRWKQPEMGTDPSKDEPASGSDTEGAPAVFNLAFRFDEPQSKVLLPPYDTFPGTGNWFEDKQALELRDRTSGGFHADVDFGQLEKGADRDLRTRPGREQARIFPSRLDLPEGVQDDYPQYGGQLQPYILTVPPGYKRNRPVGLTFSLHSLGGTYTQYAVFSPNQLRQFGDDRDNLVATPLSHSTAGWYTDESESDFFEVWADVARHFDLDPDRVALTGYSMGGYGTYKLGTQYPDLFGKAFTTVGPPGREIWVPPTPPSDGEDTNSNEALENARWLPYLNWVELDDELVPYLGPTFQQNRFDELRLRSQLWTFTPGEHFTLATLDKWDAARDFLDKAKVQHDPWRVNYAFLPAADRPHLGLEHDHAYWVSQLRVRDRTGDPDNDPARGEIDARSLAFGLDDPTTAPVAGTNPLAGPPTPNVIRGTKWTGTPTRPKDNMLELNLENVAEGVIDGPRARLRGDRELRVKITSDGKGEIRLDLRLPGDARVVEAGGDSTDDVDLSRDGATFKVSAGTHEYVISS